MSKNKYKWSILDEFKLNKHMSFSTQEEKNKAVAVQQKVVDEAKEQSAINAAKAKLTSIKESEVTE